MILRTQGMRALLTGAILLIAVAASAEKLSQVEIRSAGEASRIVLHVGSAVTHKSFVLTNPDRLVLDLVGVENDVTVSTRSVPGGPVKTVRMAQFASDPQAITRVVADLRVAVTHRVLREGNTLVLEVSPKTAGQKQVMDVATKPAVKKVDVAQNTKSTIKPLAPTTVKPEVQKSEDTVAQVFPVPVAPVQKSVVKPSSVVPSKVAAGKVSEVKATAKGETSKVTMVQKPAVSQKSAKSVSKATAKKMQEAEEEASAKAVAKEQNSKAVVGSDAQGSSKVKAPLVVEHTAPTVVPVPRQTQTKSVASSTSVAPQVKAKEAPKVQPTPISQPVAVSPRPAVSQPTVPAPAQPELTERSSGSMQPLNKGDKTWNSQSYTEDRSPKLNLTSNSRRINLDVQGADIRTVLRTLADYAGMNIIASRDVQGEVSASLKDAPWESALEAILRAHGYGYVQENGIIRVGLLERIRSEELDEAAAARKREDLLPIETRVAHMEFANAEELKASLIEMMTSRGTLQVDARTNSLIISDIPNRVELIAQMASQLDSRTPQVEIVSKIVDISNEDSQNLGIEWSAANVMAGQVLGSAGVSASTAGAAGGMRLGSVQSWGQLDLMLDALASQKKANVISNPTITTVNNREAKILVGSKIPLIVADEAGNAITQLTTIGIQMRVTPHVNSDATITLDLHPEISELSSKATVQGGVIINTSEADTRVIVQDGETAIIGGLIRDNKSEVKTGIPVLQDIPLVGWLFRNSNISDDKREMIIFVTPRLINGDLGQG